MTNRIQTIPELPGPYRLGRHIEHDERSKTYLAEQAPVIKSVLHQRHPGVPILNQGNLGSCTGNASVDALVSSPDWTPRSPTNEGDAVKIYSLATHLDGIPGFYPPDDRGSTGIGACKALVKLGWAASYTHTFGLQQALGALTLRPAMIGVAWYDSFDSPGPGGMVSISPNAYVRGGHEIAMVGLDTEAKTVRLVNSWGAAWGDGGYFQMTWDTLDRLLNEQGDVTVPVVNVTAQAMGAPTVLSRLLHWLLDAESFFRKGL